MLKLSASIILLLSVNLAFASMAECALSIKKYNSKHKSTEWGIDHESNSLVTRGEKGHKYSLDEKAESNNIKRICMAAGFSISYYKTSMGSEKTNASCQITNGRTLSELCEKYEKAIKFRTPK